MCLLGEHKENTVLDEKDDKKKTSIVWHVAVVEKLVDTSDDIKKSIDGGE